MNGKDGLALVALLISVFIPLSVSAEGSDSDQASQEQWLRYSNWEHRSMMPKHHDESKAKPGSESSSSHETGKPSNSLNLPDNPGSQTVEGTQATIPGWAFQPPPQAQRPAEYIVGGESFGSTPSFQANIAKSYGLGSIPFGGYGLNYGSGFGNLGGNYSHWGGGGFNPIAGFGGWGGAYGNLGGGWGSNYRSGSAWSHIGQPAWGNYGGHIPKYSWAGAAIGGGFSPLGFGYPYGGGLSSGLQPTRLGPQVIQTGPSPASGNYYQPSTGDSSASGNYYASGSPWQVPVNAPNNPKDYWGPGGSPFK